MDDKGMRTLFIGLLIGFGIYAASFLVRYVVPDPAAIWVSLSLTVVSMIFTIVWFIAVQRGWRTGKKENRGERRAKIHAREEQEKKRRMTR